MTSLLGQDHPVWQDEILRNIPHPAKWSRHPAKIEVANIVVLDTSLSLLPTTLVLIPSVNGRWGHIEGGIRPLDLCVPPLSNPLGAMILFVFYIGSISFYWETDSAKCYQFIKIQTTSFEKLHNTPLHCYARWPKHREKILRMSLTYLRMKRKKTDAN